MTQADMYLYVVRLEILVHLWTARPQVTPPACVFESWTGSAKLVASRQGLRSRQRCSHRDFSRSAGQETHIYWGRKFTHIWEKTMSWRKPLPGTAGTCRPSQVLRAESRNRHHSWIFMHCCNKKCDDRYFGRIWCNLSDENRKLPKFSQVRTIAETCKQSSYCLKYQAW